jgi:hypothetical protein
MRKAITGIMLAMMAMSVLSFVPNYAAADFERQGNWVRMNGFISQWNASDGTTKRTFGWIVANAAIVNESGTVHEWAMVHATWSNLTAYPTGEHGLGDCNVSDTVIVKGNFSYTFSFYIAKLLNFSEISFNKTETNHDFYLAGNWNVSQITETINITWGDSTGGEPTWSDFMRHITITWTETPVVTNATGTLVADWGIVTPPKPGEISGPIGVGTFELDIDGVGTLSGYARKSFIWARELNICDFDGHGKVGITDLVNAARHYGEAPGFQNYDLSLDVNGDGRIDIGDLTTIAANIQG